MVMYSASLIANGPFLIISGQTPENEGIIPDNIADQIDLVVNKIKELILTNEAAISSIVKMNIYITDVSYLTAVREKLTSFLNGTKPAMTLVVVAGLINDQFMLEIDATVQI